MALNQFFKGKTKQAQKNLHRPNVFGPSADQQAGFPTNASASLSRRKALRKGPRKSAIFG